MVIEKSFYTTINENHRHKWKKGNKFTSFDDGHKHRVIRGVAIPSRKGGHTHRITKRVASVRKRQFNPSQCKKKSFRTKKVSKKTSIVLCKKKGSKKQSVQSIIQKKGRTGNPGRNTDY